MRFWKYHALGNDYLVVKAGEFSELSLPQSVERICARRFGVGSDGILVHEPDVKPGHFHVRILNPDGSEAEKSGNGLRIFARFLWDQQCVAEQAFQVETTGGTVTCQVSRQGRSVAVDMGRVSFNSYDIPVVGPERDVLQESLAVDGEVLEYSAATIGNPHCVIACDEVSQHRAQRLGPLVETDSRFPNLTNVQFMKVLDRNNIRIEIWERGAGYTLASGTSACATAAVARKLNVCDDRIAVHMPGGALQIKVSPDFEVRMTGPVAKVAEGEMFAEMFEYENNRTPSPEAAQ